MRLDDPQWLRRRYEQEGLSIKALAAECHVAPKTLRRALDAAGIQRKRAGRQPAHLLLNDAEFLREAYVTRGMTTAQIGVPRLRSAQGRIHR